LGVPWHESKKVLEHALANHSMSFLPGSRGDPSGDPDIAQHARLCHAWLPPEELRKGVRALAQAVAEVKASEL